MTTMLHIGPRTGRGLRRIRPASTAQSDINVTPLVDVVLVLLIIFMVLTPLLEKNLALKIPAAHAAEPGAAVPATQLVVSLAADGTIRLGELTVSADAYVGAVRERLAGRDPSDRTVFFATPDQARYGSLVQLMDGAKQAGAEVLGFAPAEPTAQAAPAEPAQPPQAPR